MNVLSLFDGMSCGQIALNRCGIKYENYFASEIKKHAIEVTQHNYPKTIQLGNIKDIKKQDLPQIDLILAGSPCQDFSRGNKTRDGLDGQKSSLFFEFYRLYKECKPKYFILENVIMPPADYEYLSRLMDTYPVRINSSTVSAQYRDRLYWTNIGREYRDLFGFRYSDIPQPKDKRLYLKDILTSGFTDKLKSRCLLTNTGHINENKDPIVVFLYLLLSVSIIYILGLGGLWNFMGFDKTFNEVFTAGAKPFLLIEIYKILILTVLSKQLLKIRKFT